MASMPNAPLRSASLSLSVVAALSAWMPSAVLRFVRLRCRVVSCAIAVTWMPSPSWPMTALPANRLPEVGAASAGASGSPTRIPALVISGSSGLDGP